MTPKKTATPPTEDLFRARLENLIDLRHELAKLAGVIDWAQLEAEFGTLYVEGRGRPGLPIRLMAGMLYLKHAFHLSDEQTVARWVENPYWQYFCGEPYFRHTLPIDPSSLTRFRNKIGASGCEKLLALTVDAGLRTRTVKQASLQRAIIDTTVQEKAVAFPTDSRLYQRGRELLVKLAQRAGIALRQSYARKGKEALFMANRYAHARQMRRMKREARRLKTYLGRVHRDVERKLDSASQTCRHRLQRLLQVTQRLLAQRQDDRNKLYSLHAPEVECIAKGKAHKRYEFGVKVSIATTHHEDFIIGMRALPGNPYDGHTLKDSLDQVEQLTGRRPAQAFVDQGFKGHEENHTQVFIARQKRGITARLKRLLRHRNAIEPVIGHLKSDGHLGRNFLKGAAGDAINALLTGAGHNLRKILRKLRLFYALILLASIRLIVLFPRQQAAAIA
jgi:IS5 family transposase